MKQFLLTILVCLALTFAFLVHGVRQSVEELEQSIEQLDKTLDQIEHAMDSSFEEAVDEAFPYAPEGLTRWQLRGIAQKTAQAALNKLTEKYRLPQHELPTIHWRGTLNNPAAAGEARNCYANGRGSGKHINYRGHIALNEILFLRNYEEFIYIIIPHEVAHVFVCLQGGFVYDNDETDWQAEHGPEWERVMKDLGFIEPSKFSTHQFDMTPVNKYYNTLMERLGKSLGEENVSKE